MSDQQGNEAPASSFLGAEEVKQAVLPGAQLAAQREAKGWTVEHAAGQLKFATRQVLALEADNYSALPGPVTVRGFVRAYAKLLGLDPNVLVAALPQDVPMQKPAIEPQRTLSTPFSESPLPLGNRGRTAPGLAAGAVIVIVLAVAAVIAYRADMFGNVPQLAWLKQQVSKPAAAPEEPSAHAEMQQDLPPEVQDGSDKDKSKPEKAEVAVENGASPAIATVAERVSGANPVVSAQPEAANSGKSAVPVNSVPPASDSHLNISNSKDLLRLTFREDSWVEIRRGDKSTIISRLLKAGTTESFDITEPVTLVVGNAAGVDASLRGEKLDMGTSSGSNVARLSLK